MCDPISLTIGSAAISAIGSVAQGMQAASAARANAKMLEFQAKQREEKAEFDARNARNKFLRTRGAQVAAAAKTGLDIASFSDVMDDSALESGLEIKAIRYGGKSEAFQLRWQAEAEKSKARSAMFGGLLGAAGNIVGGLGQASRMSGPGVSISSPWTTTVTRAG